MLTILNLHKSQSVCWDLHRWWIKIFLVSSSASDQRLEALMTKHISTQCDQKYWSKTKTFNNNIKTKQSSSAGHHLNKQDQITTLAVFPGFWIYSKYCVNSDWWVVVSQTSLFMTRTDLIINTAAVPATKCNLNICLAATCSYLTIILTKDFN